jgi:hypothetical protein
VLWLVMLPGTTFPLAPGQLLAPVGVVQGGSGSAVVHPASSRAQPLALVMCPFLTCGSSVVQAHPAAAAAYMLAGQCRRSSVGQARAQRTAISSR